MYTLYFNPHSHKGSDRIMLRSKFIKTISIHTPTRGVTTKTLKCSQPDLISIHTPTRGVTVAFVILQACDENFNPHSHKGSDRQQLQKELQYTISIHTPTRGVTIQHSISDKCIRNFNPHSHKGSDRLTF